MEFLVKSGSVTSRRTACLVLGVYENKRLTTAAQEFNTAYNNILSDVLRRGDLEGKIGQSLLLLSLPDTLCERVLLIGCGKEREIDDRRFRQIIGHAITALNTTHAANTLWCLSDLAIKGRGIDWKINQMVDIIEAAQYHFDTFKSKKDTPRPLRRVIFNVMGRSEVTTGDHALNESIAIAAGVKRTKDLGNLPGNYCTPTYLAEQAHALAAEFPAVQVTVLDAAEMAEMGMGALLAVAKGSEQPPKFIRLAYQCAGEGHKPYVLVGKGVTFDSGGISLKPGADMDEMKYDMSGAGTVLGVLHACAQLQLPLNVIGLIPTVENMPGGRATRPGDIVTSLSGQTIEILNTDAEGRLILCDALTYAEREDPAVVIDIATLTGACVVALGPHPHGLLSNHGPLAQALKNAGNTTYDRAWELPLWDDYQEHIDSPFADMANISTGGKGGGTITAACFLSRFTKKYHWAHLDIAGTAWKTGKQKSATGRPVPLLMRYLIDRAAEVQRAAD